MSKDYPPYLDYPKERKTMTNADKIRQMSDEELLDVMSVEICQLTGNEQYIGGDFCGDCKQCLWDWLKQEVRDGDA